MESEDFNSIKNQFEEIFINQSTADKLINAIEERQKQTLFRLPKYGKTTFYVAIIILAVGFIIQAISKNIPNDQIQLFKSLRNPTIGGILSIFFTVVAYIINALFAVWALSFIPYISLRAYKVSQQVMIPLRLNSSKWIQLFAATFLPIIAFAIFASNMPQTDVSFVIKFTYQDGIVILTGGLAVWIILWASTRFISFKYIVIHLTIFSIILYVTIFFAYILGFGTVTYCVVLGMMFFLMFSADKFAEIAKRVSIYDIDNNIVEKISSVSVRENMIKIKEAETDVRKLENELKGKVKQLDNEVQISEQLQKIKSTRINFNNKVNETKLDSFNQKLDFFNRLYTILSDEYKLKVGQELPAAINRFQKDVKNMTPLQLNESMNSIITEVNTSLDAIPKGLESIKIQMKEATRQLREATEELGKDDE